MKLPNSITSPWVAIPFGLLSAFVTLLPHRYTIHPSRGYDVSSGRHFILATEDHIRFDRVLSELFVILVAFLLTSYFVDWISARRHGRGSRNVASVPSPIAGTTQHHGWQSEARSNAEQGYQRLMRSGKHCLLKYALLAVGTFPSLYLLLPLGLPPEYNALILIILSSLLPLFILLFVAHVVMMIILYRRRPSQQNYDMAPGTEEDWVKYQVSVRKGRSAIIMYLYILAASSLLNAAAPFASFAEADTKYLILQILTIIMWIAFIMIILHIMRLIIISARQPLDMVGERKA